MCLPGLQPLKHYDPVRHGTGVLDCYMEAESSAPQILKGENCCKKMVTLELQVYIPKGLEIRLHDWLKDR